MDYAKVQKFLLKDLDIPYCLTDTSGSIMWANKCFAEIIGEKKYNNKSIKTYFEGIEEDDYTIFGEKKISSPNALETTDPQPDHEGG